MLFCVVFLVGVVLYEKQTINTFNKKKQYNTIKNESIDRFCNIYNEEYINQLKKEYTNVLKIKIKQYYKIKKHFKTGISIEIQSQEIVNILCESPIKKSIIRFNAITGKIEEIGISWINDKNIESFLYYWLNSTCSIVDYIKNKNLEEYIKSTIFRSTLVEYDKDGFDIIINDQSDTLEKFPGLTPINV